jgi:hypothetical protein
MFVEFIFNFFQEEKIVFIAHGFNRGWVGNVYAQWFQPFVLCASSLEKIDCIVTRIIKDFRESEIHVHQLRYV